VFVVGNAALQGRTRAQDGCDILRWMYNLGFHCKESINFYLDGIQTTTVNHEINASLI
jgi:hypothetical protein